MAFLLSHRPCIEALWSRTEGAFSSQLAVLLGYPRTLIFLLLHRAHASCDRRSRRGSAGPSSSFLRRRLLPPTLALEADCGGSVGGGGTGALAL